MNLDLDRIVLGSGEWLADLPPGLVLIVKATFILALAWLAALALRGRNPRWRVALWRTTTISLGLTLGLTLAPPLVAWRVPTPKSASVARAPSDGPGRIRDSTPAPPPRPVAIGPFPVERREVTRVEPVPEASIEPSPPGKPTEPAAPARRPAPAVREEAGLFSKVIGAKDLDRSLLVAWLAGVVILAGRSTLGAWRLSGLVRRSREAPAWVVDEARAVAARLGVTRGVGVVRSAEVAVPCLAGLARPVLLLPEGQCLDSERSDLRAILAHELAHARGHDLAWNDALHLASLLLWFHPLAWRTRQAHAAACDAVSDAVAADLLGDVASYSRTLARLALKVAGPPPAHGLAMARSADVRRRIESLDHKLYRSPLPRRFVMPALVVVGLLAALVGSFGVTRADRVPPVADAQAEAKPGQNPPADLVPPAPPQGRLTVLVTEAATGRPLDGVAVEYRFWIGDRRKSGNPVTDREGFATVEYDPNAKIANFSLTLRKPGYVPAHVYWDGSKHPLVIPATKTFPLEKGTTIGGVVNDEVGKPIEGATVSITMPATESDLSSYHFFIASLATDARGRWRVDEAPANLGRISIRVEHPHYIQGSGKAAAGLDGVTAVLNKGLSVKGSVVDAGGNPVPGAKVVLGHDIWGTNAPEAKTDDRGRFTIERCKPGPTLITVQPEGFAPQFRDLRVEETGDTGPVDFKLGPPSLIRARVVDVAGNPVANAHFAADTWAGHRSIMYRGTTDADGRFQWKSAPKDAVQFDIHKSNFMRRSQYPLAASGEEQVVVLYPELTVTGRVTNKATGEPIPKFSVIRGMQFEGQDQVHWSRNEPTEFTDGRYSETFDSPTKGWYLRIEAPGYKPANSRAFRPDEARQVQDFALEPTAGFGGVVLGPDGQPAAGVEVAMATKGVFVSLQGSAFDRHYNAPITKTGPDGRFDFPPPDDSYLLLAAGDAGFADATADEFAKSGKLTLVPWGRVEGRVMLGSKPGANQPVSFQPGRSRRGHSGIMLNLDSEIQADAEGRFVFDKVIPGPGSVSRVVITEFLGGGQSHMSCWRTPVEVKPGATTEVTVGGKGRSVVGRVVIAGTPESPVDWRQNDPAEMTPRPIFFRLGPPRFDRYAANLDREGRFRIDDVPPGRYQVSIPVNAHPNPRSAGAGTEIGRATLDVTVPPGDEGVPVAIGDVPAKLLPTLKAGDLAPDFTARRIDGAGGAFKLADRRGKLVLVHFWATWSGPSLAGMPALNDIQKTFGADPRFELVGLSCDEEPEAPARHARENGLDWTQAFAGNLRAPVASAYLVRSIPSTFLIGPDGRILARNLRGEALEQAIRAALQDGARFEASKTATYPPRFPVTRFAAEPGDDGGAEGFAAAVLADTDPDFAEATRPHHDTLKFLSASGKELATRKDFDTCQSISSNHGLALDRARKRLYTCELVANRVTAFDLRGRRLWQVEKLDADALVVDPKTGNLWCSGGRDLAHGETVVVDPEGREVATFPFRGIDLAYDPHTDGFWLVGYGITKLNRNGEVLFQKPREGWAYAAIAINPTDGSAWVVERAHPDVAPSTNRLWHFDFDGGVLRSHDLGRKNPFAVACDPRTGTAWVVILRAEVLRFTADGRELPPLPIAAEAVAVSPTDGHAWVTTKAEALKIDDAGSILARTPFGAPSGMSWLVAF